jgi:hypothetical protein
MLFKNSVRTSKRTPHFIITKINWLTLFKFNEVSSLEVFHKLQDYMASNSEAHNRYLTALEISNLIKPGSFFVRFQVLAMICMKMAGFWDAAPCSLVLVSRCFRDAYSIHHQKEEVSSPKSRSTFTWEHSSQPRRQFSLSNSWPF